MAKPAKFCSIVKTWYHIGDLKDKKSVNYYVMPHDEVAEFVKGIRCKQEGDGIEIISTSAVSTMGVK